VEPLRDPRVRANDAYLSIVLLSRVVVQIGSIAPVPPAVIERLFATDFVFLQNLYMQINDTDMGVAETQCPTCGSRFFVDLNNAE
jgi:hypothetical protein